MRFFYAVLCILCFISHTHSQSLSSEYSLDTLIAKIDSIRTSNDVPAISFAIVSGDSIIAASALGVGNIESNTPANEESLFRIGSISKMFVALSVLKLQEEGQISLKDRVKDLAPEIEYVNQWEDTDPILVEHLLEHTTGWDDIHLPEYAHNDPTPATLKEGLDFHPISRTSRWVPGSRYSYCNAGPPVAAYIVQKITDQTFEEYVQEYFFDPIGMTTATYLKDELYDEKGVTLYKGKTPQPYWHIIMRPSGSINASALDMAAMLRFFINDAQVDSMPLIQLPSLVRMENPETTIAAKTGLEGGYGLHNYSSNYHGFWFQGHNGGVDGGSADFFYNREEKIGFAVMINSSMSSARSKVSSEIAKFLIKDLDKPSSQSESVSSNAFDGYYYQINPRQQMGFFIEQLFKIVEVSSDDSLIYMGDFPNESPGKYRAVSQMLAIDENGKKSLAITSDPLEGQVLTSPWGVFAPTSLTRVWLSWSFSILWVLGLIVAFIWFFAALVQNQIKNRPATDNLRIKTGPFLAALSLLITSITLLIGLSEPFQYLASPTLYAIIIYLGTIVFAISATGSLVISVYSYGKVDRKFSYWFFTILGIMNAIACIYLWNHNVIGMKTWV